MRKMLMILATVTTLFSLVSCTNSNTATPQNLSIEAITSGFIDGTSTTTAIWTSGETIKLYRADDWQSATFTLSSDADEEVAKFDGTIIVSEKFYALRNASPTHIVNGKVAISATSNNIFFDNENSSLVAPQIGEGSAKGLTFTPIFGAIKFAITGDFATQTIKVKIPNKEISINGDYIYDIMANTLQDQDVEYYSTRTFDTPLTLSDTPQMVYVALPEGIYSQIELHVVDPSANYTSGYIAENVTINQGEVTDATDITSEELMDISGTWHMTNYCGYPTDIDLYIVFADDMTFTIYQRDNTITYSTFSGTYTAGSKTALISGEYNDGTVWANSYKISYSGNNLVLTNTTNDTEVSVYEPAEVPTIHSAKMRITSATDVRPL